MDRNRSSRIRQNRGILGRKALDLHTLPLNLHIPSVYDMQDLRLSHLAQFPFARLGKSFGQDLGMHMMSTWPQRFIYNCVET